MNALKAGTQHLPEALGANIWLAFNNHLLCKYMPTHTLKHKTLIEIHLYIYVPNCACSSQGMVLIWHMGAHQVSLQDPPASPCDMLPHPGEKPSVDRGLAHPHFLDTFALV